jgi:FixJ family two-component response regulator
MEVATPESPRVLIADDQHSVVEALRLLLKTAGYQTEGVPSPRAALQALEDDSFDALMLDLNYTRDTTSGAEGLELLSQIQALDRNLPVVVMTAWGSMELAIRAMQLGASDFILKPWENARVLATLKTQIGRHATQRSQRQQLDQEFRDARRVQERLMMVRATESDSLPEHFRRQIRNPLLRGDRHGSEEAALLQRRPHRAALAPARRLPASARSGWAGARRVRPLGSHAGRGELPERRLPALHHGRHSRSDGRKR